MSLRNIVSIFQVSHDDDNDDDDDDDADTEDQSELLVNVDL